MNKASGVITSKRWRSFPSLLCLTHRLTGGPAAFLSIRFGKAGPRSIRSLETHDWGQMMITLSALSSFWNSLVTEQFNTQMMSHIRSRQVG